MYLIIMYIACNCYFMKMNIASLITCMVLFTAQQSVIAQTLPLEITDRIDSLFHQWNKTSSPGWAVGVVR